MEYGVPWSIPPSDLHFRCASCSLPVATEYRPFCFHCGAEQPTERELRKRGWFTSVGDDNSAARRILAIEEMNAFLADYRGCDTGVWYVLSLQNLLMFRMRYQEDRNAAIACSGVSAMELREMRWDNQSLCVRKVTDSEFGDFVFVEDATAGVLVRCRFLEMYVNLDRRL